MRRSIVCVVCIVMALSMATSMRTAASEPVVTEGVVNAPIAEVWNVWTTKEGIESWMVAKTDIDLRPGGLWRTSYSKDSTLDDDAAIHHILLAYDPGRMLAFRTIKAPRNFPFPTAIQKTWTVVYLEPSGESHTKVTVHMLGYGDDEESRKMRAFFETGNRTTLESLQKKFR
jgi:uncharacterized protein YndB with AHSA1/START domain